MLMGRLLPQNGLVSWCRYQIWLQAMEGHRDAHSRRVIQTLFTRLGSDEDTVDKPLPKVLECYVGYRGPET
jgi:hypothetical protein